MKRIFISMICLIMCCSISIAPVSAAEGETAIRVSYATLLNIKRFDSSGNLLATNDFNIRVPVQAQIATFSPNYYQFPSVYPDHTFIGLLSCEASPLDSDFLEAERLLWLYFDLEYYSSGFKFDYESFLSSQIYLVINGTKYSNFVLTQKSSKKYFLSFALDYSDIDPYSLDNFNFDVSFPLTPTDEGQDVQLAFYFCYDYIGLTYNLPPITSGDVSVIVNDLNSINTTLSGLSGNVDLILNDVSDIKQIAGAIQDNQQVVIDELVATKSAIEALPAEIINGIRDVTVGADYNKNLDTSEILAYESALDRVMEEVDVDQVIDIMGDGVSLNQPGMYNDQSFNSVSDLMTSIIDATGIMPLITLTLSIGLACFIIGRSGKL